MPVAMLLNAGDTDKVLLEMMIHYIRTENEKTTAIVSSRSMALLPSLNPIGAPVDRR
ncbi:MAG: hypothetical protein HGA43_09520 [Nitrospirae bacterium]|nr:hypothetical protein [Nitrospirota bacterium]